MDVILLGQVGRRQFLAVGFKSHLRLELDQVMFLFVMRISPSSSAVTFGQSACRTCELAGLPRIDARRLPPGFGQRDMIGRL